MAIEPQDKGELPQQETVLLLWVNAHNLHQVENVWYKDGRRVVTGGADQKQLIIQRHHNPPVHGHPGISYTTQLIE